MCLSKAVQRKSTLLSDLIYRSICRLIFVNHWPASAALSARPWLPLLRYCFHVVFCPQQFYFTVQGQPHITLRPALTPRAKKYLSSIIKSNKWCLPLTLGVLTSQPGSDFKAADVWNERFHDLTTALWPCAWWCHFWWWAFLSGILLLIITLICLEKGNLCLGVGGVCCWHWTLRGHGAVMQL